MNLKKLNTRKKALLLKLLAVLMCFAGQSAKSFAQQAPPDYIVRGVVTDESSDPLVGVTVQLASGNRTAGTVTDGEGKFSLTLRESNPTLEFSYLGYKSQRVSVSGSEALNIVLKEDVAALDEVIVVGYGAQKKSTLTGAVVSMNSKELSTSTNSNLQQNLAGKLAGVKIITNSSEPGALKSHIDVRGLGTPLIVIDGVTSDVETFSQLSSEEIENISVLKDASAAVYGMRSANGVMVVTTKKGGGGDGKPKFEYKGVYGYTHMLNMPKMMNAYDWASMMNEITESRYSMPKTTYTDEQLESFKGIPAFDVWDEFMNDYAPQTEHTISVSGSAGENQAVKYFLTGGFINEDGAYKSGSLNYNRFNFRSNVTANLGHGFTANVNVGMIKSNRKQPYQDAWNIIKWAWFVPPIHPQTGLPQTGIYANDNPEYPAYFGTELNPAVNADSNNGGGFKKNDEHRWDVQGSLQWEAPFLKGLVTKFMYNYSRRDRLYNAWNQKYSLYTYRDEQYIPTTYASPSTMVQETHWGSNNGYQASLNYTGRWNLHSVNVLALFEQNEVNSQYMGAQRYYTMDFLPYLAAGDNDKTQVIGANYPDVSRRQGLVGRLNYDYAGKYLTEFAFRYDGSSKYYKDKQWGFFPSVSAGWRISEENFFRGISALSFVDNLKLRASYGITGDDGGAAYQWASGYTYPGSTYYFGDQKVMSVNDRGAVNPNFTWYDNTIQNYGIDFNAWNGLLGATAEMFSRKRSGLPAKRNLTIPGTIGIGLPDENLNGDRTSGWEITLTHNNKINQMNYSVTGNFMYARTKNLYRERAESTSSYRNWRENNSDRYNDLWWLREWEGVITPGMDINSLPNEEGNYQNSMFSVGDFYHADLNGDGWVDGEDIAPSRRLGYPLIQYGLTFDVAWKGFDINLHFMGAAEKYVLYTEFLKAPYAFSGQAGALEIHKDRWHQDENGNWISGYYPRYNELSDNQADDTWRVKDASYLRLKSAELGYTLPKGITKQVGIEQCRLYCNGFNLLTFTGLKYMDPEYPGTNVNDPAHGDDTTWGYIYPVSMNFNFGVNITF
jgi:TonB-linked SusC/RagA family outer membrane protein